MVLDRQTDFINNLSNAANALDSEINVKNKVYIQVL